MKKIIPAYTILLFCLLISLPLAAQNTGIISGVVIDERTNLPLSDVILNIEGTKIYAVTDANGKFELSGIYPNTYTITAEHSNYEIFKINGIVISENQQKKVDISLPKAELIICSIRPIKNFGGVVYLGSGKIIDKEWIENTGIR